MSKSILCGLDVYVLSRSDMSGSWGLPGSSAHGISKQEYWSVLPFPSPGDLPNPGIEMGLPHCRQILYPLSHQGSPSTAWIRWTPFYSSRKTSISALLTMPKPLTVWITANCGKFWKRQEYQTTWSASWETCMQVRKQQLELDMEQQTGSK